MRDLARIRGEREIWITRAHLWALGVTTCCIAVLAFFVGLVVGRTESTPSAAPVEKSSVIARDAEDNALDDLLARVEAASASEPAEDVLTFPDSLSQGAVAAPPPPPPLDPTAIPVIPPLPEPVIIPEETVQGAPAGATLAPTRDSPEPPTGRPRVGKTPQAGWAIQVASFTTEDEADSRLVELLDAGLSAYRVSAVVNGVTRFRVRVGGFASREEAEKKVVELGSQQGFKEAIVTRAP